MEFHAKEDLDGWYVYDGDDPQPVAGPLPEFMAKAAAKERNERRYPRRDEPPHPKEPEPDPSSGGSGGMGGLGM